MDPSRAAIHPLWGSTTRADGLGKGRWRVEFTAADLNQLLHMTIEVNPYAAPEKLNWRGLEGKSLRRPRQQGYCLGRDVDTCKNRIMSFVGMV